MATNFEKKPGRPFGNKVIVQYDNVEKAMRKLKKKVNESGILQTLRSKEFFEKPTTKRKRKHAAAVRRWQKQLSDERLPKKMY
jgi:small subunit ribosomal protein S21